MITFSQLLAEPADWMRAGEGASDGIVMTSRVRFARNLDKKPFPGWASKTVRKEIHDIIHPVADELGHFQDGFSAELSDLDKVGKQILVERHLISLEHAARSLGCGIVFSRDQHLALMINEEDHLRIQALVRGFDVKGAHRALVSLDKALEEKLGFAFDPDLGYLSACPTNLGTGMRVSAMLHLPGLVLSKQMAAVVKGANQMGIAVRGLYGESSDALGNLFQISNQYTLGVTEEEILDRMEQILSKIIGHEKNARLKLCQQNGLQLQDQVARAFGVLRHARQISSKEALNLLSFVKLGSEFDWLQFPPSLIESLFLNIQPAHLQYTAGTELSGAERDVFRAEILRDGLNFPDSLATFPKPILSDNSEDSETEDNEPEIL